MAYSARADIEAHFGVTNVDRWADLDSDENVAKITARITASITYADATIDDAIRGGIWAVPFGTAPEGIKNASVEIAAWWLYQSRPRSDNKSDKGFDSMLEQTMKYLQRVKAGKVRFNLSHKGLVPLVSRG